MNFRNLPPEERAERARIRKQKERQRYRPIYRAKKKARRHNAVLENLHPLAVAILHQEPIPDENLFSTNIWVRKKTVRFKNRHAAIYSEWHNDFDPPIEFLEFGNRIHEIGEPAPKLRRWQPSHLDEKYVACHPDSIRRVWWYSRPIHDMSFNPEGISDCPHCRKRALTVTFRPGQDAQWRCWGCGLVYTSLEMIHQAGRPWADTVTHWALATGVWLEDNPQPWWNTMRQRGTENLLEYGRIFYRYEMMRRELPVAFGDWSFLELESIESLPNIGRITHTGYRRPSYLLRVMRAMDGRIAALKAYGLNYQPLWVHHMLSPDTISLDMPWWAMRRPWDHLLVTHDRATADRTEGEMVRRPLEEREPIALLPPGLPSKSVPGSIPVPSSDPASSVP